MNRECPFIESIRLRGAGIRTEKFTLIGLGLTSAIIIIGARGQLHYLVSYQSFD